MWWGKKSVSVTELLRICDVWCSDEEALKLIRKDPPRKKTSASKWKETSEGSILDNLYMYTCVLLCSLAVAQGDP
jgi:hypothetical protein